MRRQLRSQQGHPVAQTGTIEVRPLWGTDYRSSTEAALRAPPVRASIP